MKFSRAVVFIAVCLSTVSLASAETGSELWLRYGTPAEQNSGRIAAPIIRVDVSGNSATASLIRSELKAGLAKLSNPNGQAGLAGRLIVGTPSTNPALTDYVDAADLARAGTQGFVILSRGSAQAPVTIIAANTDVGALYGTFHLLRLAATNVSLTRLRIVEAPAINRRILNHWDNLDGSIERGYSGASLWQWNELPQKISPRYRDYARANASIGINGAVLNNVNADARILTPEYLAKVGAIADTLRPYGIRVYLSVNFGAPLKKPNRDAGATAGNHERSIKQNGIGELSSADPMAPQVRAWWKAKAAEIYRQIPDFGGFLVKANSEGMPGPQDYHRTHADGANMLAEAVAPYGGIVMWRSFVYEASVDPDRAKRGYKEFVPLDGKFAANVFVQPKNGPLDFQPQEPINPLFGAMPKTPLMLELQITQEYMGHADHLVYLAPMWKKVLDTETWSAGVNSTVARIVAGDADHHRDSGIAGVANVGSDANWSGHDFSQSNWYAFGRLAWNPALSSEAIAEEWVRQTWSNDAQVVVTLKAIMMASWPAVVDYMTPLGLVFTIEPREHYIPDLADQKGQYWRADQNGLGYDRTTSGDDYVSQYHPNVRDQWNTLAFCPEDELVFFHFVPWEYRTRSGRSLWDELFHRYDRGIGTVEDFAVQWQALDGKIDPERHAHVAERLKAQLANALEWREASTRYFANAAGRQPPVGASRDGHRP